MIVRQKARRKSKSSGQSFGMLEPSKLASMPGVHRLSPLLLINGTSVFCKFRYNGMDASETNWPAWGYGETIPRIPVATPPTYNNTSLLYGPYDDCVKFNASDYYELTTSTQNQFTTGDIVFEILYKTTPSTGLHLVDTKGAGNGIRVYVASSNRIAFRLYDSGGDAYVTSGNINSDYTWVHGLCFINRDEASAYGSQWYIDGVASGSGVNLSAISGSLSSTTFSIGDLPGGGFPLDNSIAYFAAWEYPNWFRSGVNGPYEWSEIARERCNELLGIRPRKCALPLSKLTDGDMEASGTAAWTANDSTLSKDTTAPLYQGAQHLRITSTGDTFYAGQSVMQANATYRVRGACRSGDGVATCKIITSAGATVWQGTADTTWQTFDFTFKNGTGSTLYFGSGNNHPGIVDFDDLTCELYYCRPTVATRAFPAFLDKVVGGVRKLYLAGSDWLRSCHRKSLSGVDVYGYLPEPQAVNQFLYSEDLTQADWVKTRATISSNGMAAPDGNTTADGIISSVDNNTHSVGQSMASIATEHCWSVYLKKGAKDWVWLHVPIVANCDGYFDLATPAVGTLNTGVNAAYVEDWGNGWVRVKFLYTGGVPAHSHDIYPAVADGNHTFAGDGVTVDTWVWGNQHECCAIGNCTSYIKTTTAAATRLKDELQYVAGDNIGGEDNTTLTEAVDVLFDNYDSTTTAIIEVSDGGAVGDRMYLYGSSDDRLAATTAASGGAAGSSSPVGNITDGELRQLRGTFQTNEVVGYRDGVAGTADTACDMPDDKDEIDIGQNVSSNTQTAGLLSNIRIYKKVKRG